MLYLYRELTITSKVQECCGWEFAAKQGEFDYSYGTPFFLHELTRSFLPYPNKQLFIFNSLLHS